MTGFSNIGWATGFAGVGPDGQPEGDLTGSYPNPTVVGIYNHDVDPRDPVVGDTLIFSADKWIPSPSPTSVTYFKGTWNASANTPDIANYPGLDDGFLWIVSVAGTTNLGGIATWAIGDYALYSGGNWYRLANSSFGWRLTGNTGTDPGTEYVGTSDGADFSLRANGIEGFRILSAGGTRATGNMSINGGGSLNVAGNITGSNAKLSGDLAVCGGDITTNVANFNLLVGATSRINMGNAAATNWLSGTTLFPQGISGSHTHLVDGSSAYVAGVGILVCTASNGSVLFKMSNTGSAGTYGSASSVPVFTTDAQGRVTSTVNTSIQIGEGQVTNLVTDLGNKADKTTQINAGAGLAGGGNLSADRTISMPNVGTPGTYGSASVVPVLTTDTQGRVSNVTNTSIAITATQVTSGIFPSTVAVQNFYQTVTSQVSGGSSPLSYGEVVYFTPSGGSAANPAVDRGRSNSASTSATVLGLVSQASIANGTTGNIITQGILVGNPLGSGLPYLNTNAFQQGDILYIDATVAGSLTNVKPSYPNIAIPVGIVIVRNQYTGAIYVNPTAGLDATQGVKTVAGSSKLTLASSTTSITSANFNGPPAVEYLALDFNGPGNVTLSAGPIQALSTSDYGRNLTIHNVSSKTVTFNSGGTTYLSGGVSLVLNPNSLVTFMWSFVGGGAGRWLQMTPAITVS